ncbi:hypothetical protein [Prosthecobacter sp.]|uniref:hypothetical protein n=1 Tax=Prosthecobacter sp. TaxID=1965333 RepID=UPI003783ED2C
MTYTGYGFLGLLIPLGVGLLGLGLSVPFPALLTPEKADIFFGGVAVISALLVWVVGSRLNKNAVGMYVHPTTRQVIQYDLEHTLMYIPLQWISVAILLVAACLVYQSKHQPPGRWVSKKEYENIMRDTMRDYNVVLSQYRVGIRVASMPQECVRVLPRLPEDEQPGCLLVAMTTSYEIGALRAAQILAKELHDITRENPLPLLPVAAAGTKEEQRLQPVLQMLRVMSMFPTKPEDEDKHRAVEALLVRYEKAAAAAESKDGVKLPSSPE